VTVSLKLESYLAAKTRQDKSSVILGVIDLVRENGGRFIKWKKNRWVELCEKATREKVGHALRDMAAAREEVKSSKHCNGGKVVWKQPPRDSTNRRPPQKRSSIARLEALLARLSETEREAIREDSERNNFKDVFEV